jgi:GntR family transcriptional regulator, negative regulator for fad regulon and positive regulator of fabA
LDSSYLIRPAEYAENKLIESILCGAYPIASVLPAERELAAQLGVTRPTLREALQRLARDGWLEIRQGKSTRVRDYWQEGSLGVLGALAKRTSNLPGDFVPNLLAVRLILAPAYTRQAVERQAEGVVAALDDYAELADEPTAYASYDWRLHHNLTVLSGNPIFTLILNGFSGLYLPMAERYFQNGTARNSSRAFYAGLLAAAQEGDCETAEAITRRVMAASLALWLASEEAKTIQG